MITVKKYGKKTCAPCISMGRILQRTSAKIDFNFEEIYVEEEPKLASDANVLTVPTTILYDGDKELHRFEGVKSSKELKELIQLYEI